MSLGPAANDAMVGGDDLTGAMTFEAMEAANTAFAQEFTDTGLDGVARRGVAIVTCMDSRIDPLRALGLAPGDAKIFRNPGGRVTEAALEALVLGSHLLGVKRIIIMPHTRCAVASNTVEQLQEKVTASSGKDASWMTFHTVPDQLDALTADVHKVCCHPLIAEGTEVAGYVYDVDTGRITRKV